VIKNWELSNDSFKQARPSNIYIIKPGEATNRGKGITVASELNQIK
jgi:hypothetical protein